MASQTKGNGRGRWSAFGGGGRGPGLRRPGGRGAGSGGGTGPTGKPTGTVSAIIFDLFVSGKIRDNTLLLCMLFCGVRRDVPNTMYYTYTTSTTTRPCAFHRASQKYLPEVTHGMQAHHYMALSASYLPMLYLLRPSLPRMLRGLRNRGMTQTRNVTRS